MNAIVGKAIRATGKDVFGCRSQLKADGFVFWASAKEWYGSQESVEKFNSRGFKVKVFFSEVQVDSGVAEELRKIGVDVIDVSI